MTNARIARVLREAAMYAHYSWSEIGPYHAINKVTIDMSLYEWDAVDQAMFSLFGMEGRFVPRDITILALLFAAEAVESGE